MTDRVALRGLEVQARVGVTEQERARPQAIELDVELELDLRAAGQRDDLAATVDYAALAQAVKAAAEGQPFRLLEALAERAAQAAKGLAPGPVVVRARKAVPPMGARAAWAEVEVRR